jgi:hypothetical protein
MAAGLSPKPRRTLSAISLIVGVLFTIGGIRMIYGGDINGLGVVALFGACSLISAIEFLPRRLMFLSNAAATYRASSASELTLRPGRLRNFVFLIGGAGFTAGAWWLSDEHQVVGWLGVIFFGAGAVAFAILLLPGASFLKLTRDGMTVVSLFRRSTYRWDDIDSFGVMSLEKFGGTKYVGIIFSASYQGHKIGRKMVATMTGFQGGLPDTYGMSADDLVDLLSDWRLRAQHEKSQCAAC